MSGVMFSIFCVVPVLGVILTTSEKIEILASFNAARCSIPDPSPPVPPLPAPLVMPAMFWDPDLEDLAQQWADACPGGSPDSVPCPSSPNFTDCTGFASALFGNGWKGAPDVGCYSATQLTGYWIAEKPTWSYGTYSGTAGCTGLTCDIYTNIISANVTRVGCAQNRRNCTGVCDPQKITCCGNSTCGAQLTCFFDPQANKINQYPYVKAPSPDAAVPPVSCKYTNSSVATLATIAQNDCSLALTKGFNSSCGDMVPNGGVCVVQCQQSPLYVTTVPAVTNVSITCNNKRMDPVTGLTCVLFVGSASTLHAVTLLGFALLALSH